MRIIVETYDYGVKYTDSYPNMNNFRSNVYEHEGYVVTCDNMIIDSKNIKAAYPEIDELENNSLDQVLNKPEIMDIWDGGTVIIRHNSEVVFRIQYNYNVSVDKIGLIDADSAFATDVIHKYNVTNMQILHNQVILDITEKRRIK